MFKVLRILKEANYYERKNRMKVQLLSSISLKKDLIKTFEKKTETE